MAAKPIIMRRWCGRIRTTDRDTYIAYIRETGIVDYLSTPGNLGCEMLTRDCGDGSSEVTTLSWWESIDAIRAFAGDDIDTARYYPEDDAFLLERPEHVEHHDVVVEEIGLRILQQHRLRSASATRPPSGEL